MKKKSAVKLPAEVAERYDLVGWTGSARQYFGTKMGYVDVSTITMADADRLARLGFRYLKPRAKASKEKDPAKSEI